MLKNNKSISKINRIWQQDIRAETNAERQFLRNQKNTAREQQIEEIESRNHPPYHLGKKCYTKDIK